MRTTEFTYCCGASIVFDIGGSLDYVVLNPNLLTPVEKKEARAGYLNSHGDPKKGENFFKRNLDKAIKESNDSIFMILNEVQMQEFWGVLEKVGFKIIEGGSLNTKHNSYIWTLHIHKRDYLNKHNRDTPNHKDLNPKTVRKV